MWASPQMIKHSLTSLCCVAPYQIGQCNVVSFHRWLFPHGRKLEQTACRRMWVWRATAEDHWSWFLGRIPDHSVSGWGPSKRGREERALRSCSGDHVPGLICSIPHLNLALPWLQLLTFTWLSLFSFPFLSVLMVQCTLIKWFLCRGYVFPHCRLHYLLSFTIFSQDG